MSKLVAFERYIFNRCKKALGDEYVFYQELMRILPRSFEYDGRVGYVNGSFVFFLFHNV